jgi:hypothetical protein
MSLGRRGGSLRCRAVRLRSHSWWCGPAPSRGCGSIPPGHCRVGLGEQGAHTTPVRPGDLCVHLADDLRSGRRVDSSSKIGRGCGISAIPTAILFRSLQKDGGELRGPPVRPREQGMGARDRLTASARVRVVRSPRPRAVEPVAFERMDGAGDDRPPRRRAVAVAATEGDADKRLHSTPRSASMDPPYSSRSRKSPVYAQLYTKVFRPCQEPLLAGRGVLESEQRGVSALGLSAPSVGGAPAQPPCAPD